MLNPFHGVVDCRVVLGRYHLLQGVEDLSKSLDVVFALFYLDYF